MSCNFIMTIIYLPDPPASQKSYLDLDWPAEVSHINVEGDIVVKSEVELLT